MSFRLFHTGQSHQKTAHLTLWEWCTQQNTLHSTKTSNTNTHTSNHLCTHASAHAHTHTSTPGSDKRTMKHLHWFEGISYYNRAGVQTLTLCATQTTEKETSPKTTAVGRQWWWYHSLCVSRSTTSSLEMESWNQSLPRLGSSSV